MEITSKEDLRGASSDSSHPLYEALHNENHPQHAEAAAAANRAAAVHYAERDKIISESIETVEPMGATSVRTETDSHNDAVFESHSTEQAMATLEEAIGSQRGTPEFDSAFAGFASWYDANAGRPGWDDLCERAEKVLGVNEALRLALELSKNHRSNRSNRR